MKVNDILNPDLEEVLKQVNDVRTLFTESKNELQRAIEDFIKEKQEVDFALAGGLALGAHGIIRGTQDIDLALISDADVKKIKIPTQFKKHRGHALEHKPTGVEIELVTPEFVDQTKYKSVFRRAITTASEKSIGSAKVKVVNLSALVALKLLRFSRQDQADIESLLKKHKINVSSFGLNKDHLEKLKSIQDDL